MPDFINHLNVIIRPGVAAGDKNMNQSLGVSNGLFASLVLWGLIAGGITSAVSPSFRHYFWDTAKHLVGRDIKIGDPARSTHALLQTGRPGNEARYTVA